MRREVEAPARTYDEVAASLGLEFGSALDDLVA
jgi:hypothetical protein